MVLNKGKVQAVDHNVATHMGVDTRGALGADGGPPPPPDFQALYYTLYIGMAKSLDLLDLDQILSKT